MGIGRNFQEALQKACQSLRDQEEMALEQMAKRAQRSG